MSRGKKWILRGLAVLGILCALGAALVFGLSGYVVLSTRQQFRTLEDTPAGGGGLHPGAGLRRLCRRNPHPHAV